VIRQRSITRITNKKTLLHPTPVHQTKRCSGGEVTIEKLKKDEMPERNIAAVQKNASAAA